MLGLGIPSGSGDVDPTGRKTKADEIRFGSGPKTRRVLILLGTVALFALAGGWRGYDLVIIGGVLAFHEAGHAAGMLAFGYRDVSIFFVPFFGAATSGHKASVPAWQAATVSLLGPLPGIFIGLAAWTLAPLFPVPDWLERTVFLLLVVNFLNLLPFLPFDGGHFFRHLLFGRKRWLETAFAIFGGIGIAGLALWAHDPVLAVAAWLAFAGIPSTRRVHEVVDRAERGGWTNVASDEAVLGVDGLVAEEFPDVSEARHLGLVRRALSGMGSQPPSPVAALLLVLLYLAPFTFGGSIFVATRIGNQAFGLRAQARTAFERGEYEKAVDLLARAARERPHEHEVFSELGWALNAAGRPEEAREAFSRQIEIDPRHANAYLGRAVALDRLGRFDDADVDLTTQVEVAPSNARALAALGSRRLWQRRLDDAVTYLSRATTLEPNAPAQWINLGWAQSLAGHPAAARIALERAHAESLPDVQRVSAATVYGTIGEPKRAARLAATAVPALADLLAGRSPATYGQEDLSTTHSLTEAWALVGAGAIADGDIRKAERYLGAAWRRGFVPLAAWNLGLLRQRQGRLPEALELWESAALVPAAPWKLPADYRRQLQQAAIRLWATGPVRNAGDHLTAQRTVRVAGPAVEKLAEPVLLLVGATGNVEDVRGLQAPSTSALERQLRRRGSARLTAPPPDESPLKTVHKGLLVCTVPTGCAIVLDLL